jgi:hypothetical protein
VEGEAMSKRMGGMGKLSDFGKPASSPEPEPTPVEPTPGKKTVAKQKPETASKPILESEEKERLITVNIKILEQQQEWLANTSKRIRKTNTTPVPPGDRVYPQHLIQTAIDLLMSAELDWSQVRNVAELKEKLGIKD